MTTAFIRAPFVQSASPCGLNTARFAVVPGSKRNPCERWRGVKLVGVLDLGVALPLPPSFSHLLVLLMSRALTSCLSLVRKYDRALFTLLFPSLLMFSARLRGRSQAELSCSIFKAS